jgi:uncharacterized membrane protein YdjX (TVP38/TMEM64 family)
LATTPSPSSQKNGLWLPILIMTVVIVLSLALLLALFWGYLSPWIEDWSRFLTSKEKVRAWIMSYGSAAPLIFVALQILQVVIAPIPGEATGFLGGYLFGTTYGFLLSMVGLAIGSMIAFLLGRWLEIHFVEKIVAPETLAKFDFIVERQGALIAFLLFLIPGFPKDYLSFIMGLSKMPLRVFMIIATVGRLPATLLLTMQGANVYEGNYVLFFVSLGIFLLVGSLGFLYKETIYRWLRRWSKRQAAAGAWDKGPVGTKTSASPDGQR